MARLAAHLSNHVEELNIRVDSKDSGRLWSFFILCWLSQLKPIKLNFFIFLKLLVLLNVEHREADLTIALVKVDSGVIGIKISLVHQVVLPVRLFWLLTLFKFSLSAPSDVRACFWHALANSLCSIQRVLLVHRANYAGASRDRSPVSWTNCGSFGIEMFVFV